MIMPKILLCALLFVLISNPIFADNQINTFKLSDKINLSIKKKTQQTSIRILNQNSVHSFNIDLNFKDIDLGTNIPQLFDYNNDGIKDISITFQVTHSRANNCTLFFIFEPKSKTYNIIQHGPSRTAHSFDITTNTFQTSDWDLDVLTGDIHVIYNNYKWHISDFILTHSDHNN